MKPFQSFNELNLPAPLARALHDMQFKEPTEVQAASIPAALGGRDILGTAQTGTGKTGAFGIPMLAALAATPANQALVLAPTRELAAQIYDVLSQMGTGSRLSGILVVGGESFHRQVDHFRRGANWLVATPGRLNDHLQERTVSLSGVRILVMDEVDRMLDMGFAPQIRKIMQHVSSQRQTLLFSATLPDEVKSLAGAYLKDPVRVAIGQVCAPAPKVEEEIVRTTQEGKTGALLKAVTTREGKILIFCRTKSRAERVARNLQGERHRVALLHGGRSQGQRKDALQKFRTGSSRIMVATDLAARGIDIDDIEHVINFDVPESREDYIHRIGRTARFGKTGKALNFLVASDASGDEVLLGVKRKPRVVFRSHRRRR